MTAAKGRASLRGGVRTPRAPITDVQHAFIAHLQSESLRKRGKVLSPKTTQTVLGHLRMVEARLPDHLPVLDEAVCDRSVMEQVIARLGAELAPVTVSGAVLTLAKYARWRHETGALPGEPRVTREDAPRVRYRQRTNVWSEDQTEVLLAASAMAGERVAALFALLNDTGLRIGEALALEWSDVRASAEPPHVVVRKSKNGKPRSVPLSDRLVGLFTNPGFVSTLQRGGGVERVRNGRRQTRTFARSVEQYPFPWSYSTIQRIGMGVADDAQVPWHGFHAFRHGFATSMLARGAPAHAVMALLGHNSLNITLGMYSHVNTLSWASLVQEMSATWA